MAAGDDTLGLIALLSESLRAHARSRRFAAGAPIVREGDAGSSAFILLSGSCHVSVHGDVLGLVAPGEIFGDIACVEGGTRTATVCATSAAEVLEIEGDALRVELRRSPALLDRFLSLLAHRVRHISQRETFAREEHHELRKVLEGLQPSLDAFKTNRHLFVDVRWQPLTFASGDYYEVLELSPNRFLFALGDVMGHGAPTAPIYGMVRSQLRETASSDSHPHDLLGHLHQHMRRHGLSNVFMTLSIVILDVKSQTAEFSIGGPPCPLLYSPSRRTCRALTERPDWTLGYPFEGVTFHSEAVPVTHGDTLLFYTDGLSDAELPDDERHALGADGVATILTQVCDSGSDSIVDRVFRRVQDFRGGRPPTDDATALVVQVR